MTAPFTKEQWAEIRRASTEAVPALIAELGLPKALLGYQSGVLRDLEEVSTRVLFVEKSRRIGLTWGLASYAVLRAARQKAAGGMDAMYISYSQEMTREFIDACGMWARAFNHGALEAEEFLFDDSDDTGDRSINAFRIRFASGFEILALSSAPRTLRGKQGVVIIDEAAFVDSLKELLKAALAFLMWGGQVVVCSTHNGADNEFNVQVQDILGGRSKFRHVRIDFDQALRDGLYQRICFVRGLAWSPEGEAEWRQEIIDFYGDGADEELFCIPSQGSGTWLPSPLIEARMTSAAKCLRLELPADYLHMPELARQARLRPFMEELEAELAKLDMSAFYGFGFDFGRVADLSTGSLLALEGMLRRREALSFELRNVPGDEQKMITRTVLNHVRERLIGAAFDATGMGWTVAEDMGRLFGLYDKTHNETGLVRAIKFSEEWYRLEMPPLKVHFEDDVISIGRDAEHLVDLRLVKMIRGVPRVPDIRTGTAGKKRHGDYAICLALADYATRLTWSEYAYEAVPAQRDAPAADRFDDPDAADARGWWASPLGARLRGSV
jgi:phage FluMu gp28-like protein